MLIIFLQILPEFCFLAIFQKVMLFVVVCPKRLALYMYMYVYVEAKLVVQSALEPLVEEKLFGGSLAHLVCFYTIQL